MSVGRPSTDDPARLGDRTVKSAERALRLLEILGGSAEPMSVVDLHRATGWPRSSLHQLIRTMRAAGWLETSADGARVAVGTRALLVGTSYLDRDPALVLASRTLEHVRDETGWTTHYARLAGPNVVYLATREAADAHRATSRVGRQLPAHATALGKALLAQLTDAEVDALLGGDRTALTDRTVTDAAVLREQLRATRERGTAHEREENTVGVCCVGVPVQYRIPATDAISCSIPVAAGSAEECSRVAGILLTAAAALTVRLRAEGIR